MRRGALIRRAPLRRSYGPRARRKPIPVSDARTAWKTAREGSCAVCGATGLIFRHHILPEQHIRREGRQDVLYDLRNALDVGAPETCSCHHDHHRRLRAGYPWCIPLSVLPGCAVVFAFEVLGESAGRAFLLRCYLPYEQPERRAA